MTVAFAIIVRCNFFCHPANQLSRWLSLGRVSVQPSVPPLGSSPMDHWHPIQPRADEPDSVHQWARLEGTSATMREELSQRYIAKRNKRGTPFAAAGIFCELVAVAIKGWWQIHGR